MKISEQTSGWVRELRSQSRSTRIMGLHAQEHGDAESGKVLAESADALSDLADAIHARFVAPSIGKPPVTRTRKPRVS